MTGFDYGLMAILGVSCVLGVWRGLIKELLSLVSYALAGLAAIWWGPILSKQYVLHWIGNDYLRLGVAYVGLFILVLLLVGLLNMALGNMLRETGLTPADRGLGLLYGFLRGLLFILLIVVVLGYTPVPEEPWWKDAMFSSTAVDAVQQIKLRLPAPVNNWLPY